MSEWANSSTRKRKAPSDGAHGRPSGDDPANEAKGPGEHDKEEWSEETRRSFVAAVFHLGLKHSSPSVIHENMSQTPAVSTSERIKSHLQKFRKNKAKAKEEFMEEYDSFLKRAIAVGDVGSSADNTGAGKKYGRLAITSPTMLQRMGMSGKASGGAGIAAYLTYLDMLVGDSPANGSAESSETGKPVIAELLHLGEQNAQNMFTKHAGPYLKLPFPDLSDAERKSPLGVSLMYSIGCISSLTQHLLQERASQSTTASPFNGTGANPEHLLQERASQSTMASPFNGAGANPERLLQERASQSTTASPFNGAGSNPVARTNETQGKSDTTPAQSQGVPEAEWGISIQQGTLYVQESNSPDAGVDSHASINPSNKTESQMLTTTSASPNRQQIPPQGNTVALTLETTPADPDFPLDHRQYGASRMEETSVSMNNNINIKNGSEYLEENVANTPLPEQESLVHALPRSNLVREQQMDPILLREEQPPQQLSSPNNNPGAQLAFSGGETTERRPSNYGFFQPIPESDKGDLVLEETFKSPLIEEEEDDDDDSDCSPSEEWFSEV